MSIGVSLPCFEIMTLTLDTQHKDVFGVDLPVGPSVVAGVSRRLSKESFLSPELKANMPWSAAKTGRRLVAVLQGEMLAWECCLPQAKAISVSSCTRRNQSEAQPSQPPVRLSGSYPQLVP